MRKLKNKVLLLFVTALLSTPAAFAWGWGGNNDNCNDVPLDGGISLLAVAGVGYGAKKIAEKRKKDQQNKQK